eukprot:m51a1_g550 putative agc ndr protein kinase orb6 (577) ;mRNA; r:448974-451052
MAEDRLSPQAPHVPHIGGTPVSVWKTASPRPSPVLVRKAPSPITIEECGSGAAVGSSSEGAAGSPGSSSGAALSSGFDSGYDTPGVVERRGTVAASHSPGCPRLEDILGTKFVPENPETYTEGTRKRSHVYKVYMRQFYRDLFQYRNQRMLRKADLEHEIDTLCLRGEQAAAVREELRVKETQYLRLKRTKTKINDFTILAMLGKGGYGEVYLARENQTSRIIALKRMTKNSARMKNQSDEVQRERNVLTTSQSPWIIRLYCTFQDSSYLYMGMEYAPGGDLRWMLNNLGRFEDAMCSTYMSEMVVCVKYLHSLGYTHRDLKPGNFVIDSTGHLKLIDFGLSSEGWEQRNRSSMQARTLRKVVSTDALHLMMEPSRMSFSIVGSPDYMCPEMLEGTGYDHRADWWALGAILFEMSCGYGAFQANSAEEAFENVLNYQKVTAAKPVMPSGEDPVPGDAWDLICGLLAPAERRLGHHGASEVMAHPYFVRRQVDWEHLRDKPGPFVPNLQGETDTSYFGDEESRPDVMGEPALTTRQDISHSVATEELPTGYFSRIHDESYFAGFTYKAFPASAKKIS